MEWALGALAAVFAGIAAWLWAARARLAGEAGGLARERDDLAARLKDRESQERSLSDQIGALRGEAAELRTRVAESQRHHEEDRQAAERAFEQRLEDQRQAMQVRERALTEQVQRIEALGKAVEERVGQVFGATASKALSQTSADFLRLAETRFKELSTSATGELERRREAVDQLVKPVRETLERTEQRLAEMGKAWAEDKGKLASELERLGVAGETLRAETGKLVKALREPQVRGRYGEIQLRRVVELAGLRSYCDFAEQHSTRDAEGNILRPDLVVRLPHGRELAIDAKTNIKPYLDAIEATDPAAAETALDAFAAGVADQARKLAGKGYWRQYEGSPDLVVMFLPGDQFVDAALSRRPALVEELASQRVLLASPGTLLGLLRAVHLGYQEQTLARQAQELRALGVELHERASVAMAHVERLGKSLAASVKSYNDFVASYETRLRPTLRKFEESGAGSAKELPTPTMVEVVAREPARATPLLTFAPDRDAERDG